MKVFIEPSKKAEYARLVHYGSLNLIDGFLMSYSSFEVPSFWHEDIDKIRRVFPSGLIIGLVPTNCQSVQEITEFAEGILGLTRNKNSGILLPPTWQGLNACKALAKKGKTVCVGPCETVFQAILAAKANASYVSLFNFIKNQNITSDSMKLIQEIKEHLENYPSLNPQIIATSISNLEQVNLASSFGADGISVSEDFFPTIISLN